jgi:hypothetical protein
MHFLASREYPLIDSQTMAESVGYERLFRTRDGAFWLYLSSDERADAQERIIRLSVRDAIMWLNEAPENFGLLWHIARVVPALPQNAKSAFPPRKPFSSANKSQLLNP